MVRVRESFSGVRRYLVKRADRVRRAAWPVAQASVSAGLAWFVTHTVLGHPQPFFAPIAAMVALAQDVGGRGRQAMQMFVGVAVGVVVGSLSLAVIGPSAPELALLTAVAMLVAAAFMYDTLPLIQAGASAVLVVVLQGTGTASERLLDTLVGGGIALIVSQVLFAPSPVSILANAGRTVLNSISEGLQACAQALTEDEPSAAGAALARLRDEGEDALSNLSDARQTGRNVARRTLRGRREKGRVEALDARLEGIDLLFTSALLLTRATHQLLEEQTAPKSEWLQGALEDLARAVEALAGDPESRDGRRRAHDLALQVRENVDPGTEERRVAVAAEQARLVAADIIRVASPEHGKDPDAAGS